jgi:hypothetical protein
MNDSGSCLEEAGRGSFSARQLPAGAKSSFGFFIF